MGEAAVLVRSHTLPVHVLVATMYCCIYKNVCILTHNERSRQHTHKNNLFYRLSIQFQMWAQLSEIAEKHYRFYSCSSYKASTLVNSSVLFYPFKAGSPTCRVSGNQREPPDQECDGFCSNSLNTRLERMVCAVMEASVMTAPAITTQQLALGLENSALLVKTSSTTLMRPPVLVQETRQFSSGWIAQATA